MSNISVSSGKRDAKKIMAGFLLCLTVSAVVSSAAVKLANRSEKCDRKEV